MNDDGYKRAIRVAVVFGMISLICLMALTFYVTFELKKLNGVFLATSTNVQTKLNTVKNGHTPQKGIDYFDGQDGVNGNDGQDGRNGRNGTDSTSTNTVQPLFTNVPVQGEKGEKGDQGDPGPQGPPGRTVFQRTNPETGAEECRYAGDATWQPITECQ